MIDDVTGEEALNLSRKCLSCHSVIEPQAWFCANCMRVHGLSVDMEQWPAWATAKVTRAYYRALDSRPDVSGKEPPVDFPRSKEGDAISDAWEYIRWGMT